MTHVKVTPQPKKPAPTPPPALGHHPHLYTLLVMGAVEETFIQTSVQEPGGPPPWGIVLMVLLAVAMVWVTRGWIRTRRARAGETWLRRTTDAMMRANTRGDEDDG